MDTVGIQDLNLPVRNTEDPNLVADDETSKTVKNDPIADAEINASGVKGKNDSVDIL